MSSMSKLRWKFKLVSKSKLKFFSRNCIHISQFLISWFHISYWSISLFPGTAFIDRERITSMWSIAPVGRRTDVTLPQVFYTTNSSCLWAWCYMLFVNDDDDGDDDDDDDDDDENLALLNPQVSITAGPLWWLDWVWFSFCLPSQELRILGDNRRVDRDLTIK